MTLLVSLVPPARLGVRSQGPLRELWLPRWGWRVVDRELRKQLDRVFSIPMVLIALLVLPVLGIEFGWPHEVERRPALALGLAVANSLIWFAFAFEFVLMMAVTNRKLRYALTHWIDVTIIVLPMVQFLPLMRVLRLGRILRLEQLTRMGRLYRLQGLALRAWRALLLLEVIQRLTGQSLVQRLAKLRNLEAAKEEELDDLREEIARLEERIRIQPLSAVGPLGAPAREAPPGPDMPVSSPS
jgi:voltage-gated potassium channel